MDGWEEENHPSIEAAMGGGVCRSEFSIALLATLDQTGSLAPFDDLNIGQTIRFVQCNICMEGMHLTQISST